MSGTGPSGICSSSPKIALEPRKSVLAPADPAGGAPVTTTLRAGPPLTLSPGLVADQTCVEPSFCGAIITAPPLSAGIAGVALSGPKPWACAEPELNVSALNAAKRQP